ncbi:tail fiber protein [Achromobacter phage Mano]|uniref:Tail fiber protein n=1 Tax=Achromobacter phage Mano TaxID=2767570 RepID=A0A7L8G6B5_9CAUD|nr:tail protein [Achromobacter phage Mano]QOE32747.1 tail fiber protein [Achromobacter phage Mano]
MAATYYTLLTKVGQAKIANAIALGQSVAWTHMAVGDGNGNPTTPNENQTALVRENYRAAINQLTVDPENPNYMVAELIVPTNVGGWTVYEVGIFDQDGDLIAVANFPATYKPQLAEGSGRDLVVRIIVQVSNASVVTLKVDPAIVLASQKWVADNYLLRAKVAGGTTGQVLAKSGNANEQFAWVDPTAAVNVIVDARPERQTLADGQTIVNLAVNTTQALAVYIEGVRLIETVDYTVNSATQLTLARSYPAGSRIHTYQNDPTSMIADASEAERGFIKLATVAEAQTFTNDGHAITPKKFLDAIGIAKGSAKFVANGSFTVPAGVTKITVSACAGGGGGGGGAASQITGSYVGGVGGGGGAGQSIVSTQYTVTPGQVIAITIGGGGAGGAAGTVGGATAANGTAGGNTVIGTLVTLIGGAGGGGGSSSNQLALGGGGGAGYPNGSAGANVAADSLVGCQTGAGASSPFGGGGGCVRASTDPAGAGLSAYGYGAGGGGGGGNVSPGVSRPGGVGGNGAPGIVVIEW